MSYQLAGQYHTWNLLGHKRSYAEVTLPYSEAKEYVIPVRYNALTGRGEQRALFDAHVRKLRSEMVSGNFTPTQMSAGLHERHRKNLTLNNEAGTFELSISQDDPLAQTDGGHRYGALDLIEKTLKEAIEKATDEKAKASLEDELAELNKLPIGIRIYFDGNLKNDFINLQSGRPVDQAHMLSLKIQQRVLSEPEFKLAFDIAKELNKEENSPFKGLLRFDSRISDKNSLIKQLPISTLFAKSSSDLATSLVGLARVGLAHGKSDASFLSNCVIESAKSITSAGELASPGRILAVPRNGGSKGSATMLVGVAVCLAQRVLSQNRTEITEKDVADLISSAQAHLNKEANGTFSGGVKRQLIGAFARHYLAGTSDSNHDGLPTLLVKTLSPSAYDALALPKESKKTSSNKNSKKKVEPTSENTTTEVADDEDVTTESLNQVVGDEASVGEEIQV